MITVQQLLKKAEHKFNDFLKFKIDVIFGKTAKSFFPLEIKSDKGSTSGNLSNRENELRSLMQKCKEKIGKGYKLVFEEIKTRTNGVQSKLSKILFETEEDFLFSIKKEKQTLLLTGALSDIQSFMPKNTESEFLYKWALGNTSVLITDYSYESNFWRNICICVQWFNQNSNSGLYIREIPLPVHTKFIEQNSALIKSLSIRWNSNDDFITTFKLKGKSDFVRFRSISKNINMRFSNTQLAECNMRLEDFCKLDSSFVERIRNVFIIENEMVYLTMPEFENSICVWGQGYRVNILNCVEWLETKNLFYFGDLDEHGFDILSAYRNHFPYVKSFCMTQKVLKDYETFRVIVENKTKGHLSDFRIPENLTEDEKDVFMDIRNSEKNRLEQERISVGYINNELEKLKEIHGKKHE